MILTDYELTRIERVARDPSVSRRAAAVKMNGDHGELTLSRSELIELLSSFLGATPDKELIHKLAEEASLLTRFNVGDPVRVVGKKGAASPGTIGVVVARDESEPAWKTYRVEFESLPGYSRTYPAYQLEPASEEPRGAASIR